MSETLPEVDRGALVAADLAWVETPGSHASKTKAAIRAYLWAVENPAWSLAEWRALTNSPAPEASAGVGEGVES